MATSLGFWRCWAMVVGGMIGTGVFMLPAILAPYGRLSVLGWLFTGGGTVFGTVGRGMAGGGAAGASPAGASGAAAVGITAHEATITLRIAGRGGHHFQHVDGRVLLVDPFAKFDVPMR